MRTDLSSSINRSHDGRLKDTAANILANREFVVRSRVAQHHHRRDSNHVLRRRRIRFMRLAIIASQRAVANGNLPFGAALVRDGQLLQVSCNHQRTASDCTGHAEVVLIREAAMKHGAAALRGATVNASGEPCAI